VKFKSAGVRLWATYYGGSEVDNGYSCATDAIGNVYLAGTTTSTNNIASGGHQNTLGGRGDAFLVKFNSSGVRQWATYYGGSDVDIGSSCATDGDGNVYMAGETWSRSGIAYGGHQDTFYNDENSFLGNNSFLVKYNGAGVRQWATYYALGPPGGDVSCAADVSGNVYLAGSTGSTDNIALAGHQNISGGQSDAYLVQFNSAGVRQWATYYGGEKEDVGNSCVVDNNGNVYLIGKTNSFNNIAYNGHQNTYDSLEVYNSFLVKFDNSISYKLVEFACGSYYWAAKKKTYTTSNFTDTIKRTNLFGFDKIVTLNLTIFKKPNPTIVKTGYELSTQSYNTYQWLKNGTNISWEVQQSYTVSSDGSYQVEVTDTNNCKGISASLNVIVSSLNKVNKDYFKIYPNPSEKMLHIETNESGNWQASITDMKGSQINQIQFNKTTQLDISSYAPGVYYIQLTSKEEVLNYKFIKK
jgi:hypothetical protein